MKNKRFFSRYIGLLLISVILLSFSACSGTLAPDNGWQNNDEKYVVCIDAGHGFVDPGAINDNLLGLYEKDINLTVALNLEKILTEKGFDVYMTRNTDEAEEGYKLDAYARADFVKSIENPDIFISIHCDSFPSNEDTRGLRVHYDTTNPDLNRFSKLLSEKIAASVDRKLTEYEMPASKLISYGPLDAGIYVLRQSEIPAALVELGFITNKADANLMLSKYWQEDVANAIADGICDFLGYTAE